MAEIIPFEPDPDNAGVGIGNRAIILSHILSGQKGCGFAISDTQIVQAKRSGICGVVAKTIYFALRIFLRQINCWKVVQNDSTYVWLRWHCSGKNLQFALHKSFLSQWRENMKKKIIYTTIILFALNVTYLKRQSNKYLREKRKLTIKNLV